MPARKPTLRPRVESLEARDVPAAGALDTAFSGDGLATANVGFSSFADMALQADGKAVILGKLFSSRTSSDFAVARLNADGTVDRSFGQNGLVLIDFKGKWDEPTEVVIQPDGKILVGGSANVETAAQLHDTAFALTRLNANGSLDKSFGKVMSNFGDRSDGIHDIALQPDGKIVVAGNTNGLNGAGFVVARYTASGKLDSTFGTGGVAATAFGFSEGAGAVAVLPDGRIVAAGASDIQPGASQQVLARYTVNGVLDPTFGTGGKVVTTIPTGMAELAVDSAGRLLTAYTLGDQFTVARFDTSGGLDPLFGVGGVAAVPNPTGHTQLVLAGMTLQSDGQIVLAGVSVLIDPDDPLQQRRIDDFAVARLNGTDGSLDASFGAGGWTTTDFGTTTGGSYSSEGAFALGLTADGKILLAGASNASGAADAALARYLGN